MHHIIMAMESLAALQGTLQPTPMMTSSSCLAASYSSFHMVHYCPLTRIKALEEATTT